MSGHSKWASIKRQKGVADVKRGQTFTKLSNAITIAVIQGGGVSDPEQNFRLRLVIEKAKAVNMPKENINRAVSKALGRQVSDMVEVVYEGFGPNGIAVIVEAVTDNKQRTTSEIKNIFDKMGGTFGQPGSTSYQFENKGLITITDLGRKTVDDIFLIAADAGAEDIEQAGSEVLIDTKPEILVKVRNALSNAGISVIEAELVKKPTTVTEIESSDAIEKINAFINKLESLDDVQKVYTNVAVK